MSDALINGLFEAVDGSDWSAMERLFHARIVYERPGYEPFDGLERVLRFYQKERILASGKHHLEHIVCEGSAGACWGRFVGFKKDGSAVDELFADVYFFEDGQIRKRRSYFFRPAV